MSSQAGNLIGHSKIMRHNETNSDGEPKALLRRIKRHVTGQDHRFAVILPPELGPVCLEEIRSHASSAEITDAGIEFSGRLTDAYNLHIWLRTATRLLCRMPPFRAGIAEELFYKTSRIPWELWLNPHVPLSVEAHVAYSRISHEGRTAEIVRDAIQKAFPGGIALIDESGGFDADESVSRQRILVHLVENHCTISMDMSGRHLHERGYRLEHTGAPLRETLAAGILLKCGWKGDAPLVDGMCGSGTLAAEAALISRRIAPGIGREFLFQKWPSFQKESWNYLCRKALEDELAKAPERIIGIDSDEEAVKVSGRNAARARVEGDIEWRNTDFFSFEPVNSGLKKGLVVLNPPYGKRLEGGGGALYRQIGEHLRRNFRGWKYAVLAPTRSDAAALGMGSMRFWGIRHGGMNIIVALGVVV